MEELFAKARIVWAGIQVFELSICGAMVDDNLVTDRGVEVIMDRKWEKLVTLKLCT